MMHLDCHARRLPVGFALVGAKVDERQLLLSILEAGPTPDCRAATPDHDRGKNYYGKDLEAAFGAAGLMPLRASQRRAQACRLRRVSSHSAMAGSPESRSRASSTFAR